MISYAILYNNLKYPEAVDKVYDFFPLMSMWHLIPEPFTKLNAVRTIQTQVGVENYKNYDVQWITVLTVLVWTAIFIYSSYKIIKKRDL